MGQLKSAAYSESKMDVVDTVLLQIKKGFRLPGIPVFMGILIFYASTVQSSDIFISMASHRWQHNQRITFSLFASPTGPDASKGPLPDHVACRLENRGQTRTVIARMLPDPDDAQATMVGGVRYAFDPPPLMTGTVRMQVAAFSVPAIVFEIAPPSETAAEATYPTLDSLFTLYQPYIGNIGAYKPMYFLAGIEPEKSKFQISFNYRLFNPESDLAEGHPWIRGFHFGYTQTSFWDLGSSSAPFEDTSYKPELFWVSKNLMADGPRIKGLFLQTGIQHESNGRGGDESRSTNFLYAQPIFIFYSRINHYGFQVAPRIWIYVANDDDTNPDLDRYRGYFDLELKAGKMDSLVLGASLSWAEKGASVQMDLTYPLHRFLFNTLDIYLHAQYVNALAENLINYQERSHALRIGFSIIR